MRWGVRGRGWVTPPVPLPHSGLPADSARLTRDSFVVLFHAALAGEYFGFVPRGQVVRDGCSARALSCGPCEGDGPLGRCPCLGVEGRGTSRVGGRRSPLSGPGVRADVSPLLAPDAVSV
jgi:hypothetical protein